MERAEKIREEFHRMMKEFLRHTIGKLLEKELEEYLGYSKHERREDPDNYRNGYYEKKVNTSLGEIDIKVPRDRKSEFEPALIPKGEKSLVEDLQKKLFLLYSKGLSTRDIQDILEDVYGTRLSASTISRITDRIIPEINEWLTRPLKEIYSAIFIDCLFVSVRSENRVSKKALYVVAGVDTDGFKEILGFWISETESASFWLNVLNDLKARGVEDVIIFVSDGLKGIEESIRAVFPNSDHQKCFVHKVRNSLKKVKNKDKKIIAKELRAIYMAINEDQARQRFEEFKAKYQDEYKDLVKSWENDLDSLLTFFKYPYEIRRMLATTNFIESINSKIKKVTYGKKIFPDDMALLKVCYGVALDLDEKWQKPVKDWETIKAQLQILFEGRI